MGDLTPTEDLVLDTLTARWRLGEQLWTLDRAIKSRLKRLQSQGIIHVDSAPTYGHIRAGLTDHGLRTLSAWFNLTTSIRIARLYGQDDWAERLTRLQKLPRHTPDPGMEPIGQLTTHVAHMVLLRTAQLDPSAAKRITIFGDPEGRIAIKRSRKNGKPLRVRIDSAGEIHLRPKGHHLDETGIHHAANFLAGIRTP